MRHQSERAVIATLLSGLCLLTAGGPAGATAPAATTAIAVHLAGRHPAAVPVQAPTATDLTDGLRVEAAATYTVDLAAAVVRVEYVATLTNTTPNTTTQSGVRHYYFTGYTAPVVPGASNVRAEQGGRALRVTVEEGDSVSWAQIRLAANLDYRESQTIRLTYDLLGQPARAGTAAQVNAAYATFPVWVNADPGLGAVSVRLPLGTEHDIVGGGLPCTYVSGAMECVATALADPATWYASVAVRDDDAMVEHTVDVSGKEVHLLAWPGDQEWLDFMTDTVERGLPILEDAFGRSWGVRPRLDVVETSAPYLYGYAGWYELTDSRIEIGDALDAEVALHEIAHAWLNSETFADRWVLEGLAQEYAARATEVLGLEPSVPEEPAQDSAVAVPLAGWTDPDLTDPDAAAREAYGYGASWWLTHQIVEEIGQDAMSDVIAAGADSLSPYPAPTTDDRLPTSPTWHTYLDLLEGVGGSTRATELFRELAVAESDVATLDLRLDARAAYAELVEAGDGWAPPAAVRTAMTEWRFEDALAQVPLVEDVLAGRAAIAETLAAVDAGVPTALQQQVESATELAELADVLVAADSAAEAYADAAGRRAAPGPLAGVGLFLDGSADRHLDAASSAMDRGDWTGVRAAAQDASAGLDRATLIGGVLTGLLVLAGAGAALVLRRRRRTADRRSAADPKEEPAEEAALAAAEPPMPPTGAAQTLSAPGTPPAPPG